jgi:putative transposase
MARKMREKSSTGTYHILLRGVNKLFLSETDYREFEETLRRYFFTDAMLYGYCLLPDHIHLLLHEGSQDVSKVIKPICTSYARYYNRRHNHEGKIFYDRYKSEVVETDEYLLEVLRFIHSNPQKQGMSEWQYSSEREYNSEADICDTQSVFEKAGGKRAYREWMQEDSPVMCLEDIERMSEKEIGTYIQLICGYKPQKIKTLSKDKRMECLEKIKAEKWISNRRISEIVGISRSVIDRMGALVEKQEKEESIHKDKSDSEKRAAAETAEVETAEKEEDKPQEQENEESKAAKRDMDVWLL